jgi:hypothetical protein
MGYFLYVSLRLRRPGYATILMMNVYLIYNRQTSGERQMADYAKRLDTQQTEYQLVDADSPQGIGIVEAFDVMGRPAIVVSRSDGSPLQVWQYSESFPPPAEVSYLAHQ